jgi:surface carbohydrate biosynthesis protein
MTVYLPIITKVRELDARLLLAATLAARGHTVVVGETRRLNHVAFESAPGTYLSPILVPAAARRLADMRRRGHAMVGWDEEGLVYPDPEWYATDRVSPSTIDTLDAFVTWGRQPLADLERVLPLGHVPRHAIGNPRIDLLRQPFRSLYAEDAADLARRLGPYVLVNTNFDLVNNADGASASLDRLRASGRIRTPEHEHLFAAWADFRRALFESFLAGLSKVRAALPELRLVVRPHPSEDRSPYDRLAAEHPGIEVHPPTGPVVPWILGAEAVLHNSCTTAIEAFVLGVPAVALRPPTAVAMESPLPNDLSHCAADWDEVVEVLRWGAAAADGRAGLAERWIASLDGAYASERLADLVEAVGCDRAMRRRRVAGTARRHASHMKSTVLRRSVDDGSGGTGGADARQRFPGLALGEVEARLAALAPLLGATFTARAVTTDVFEVRA